MSHQLTLSSLLRLALHIVLAAAAKLGAKPLSRLLSYGTFGCVCDQEELSVPQEWNGVFGLHFSCSGVHSSARHRQLDNWMLEICRGLYQEGDTGINRLVRTKIGIV